MVELKGNYLLRIFSKRSINGVLALDFVEFEIRKRMENLSRHSKKSKVKRLSSLENDT